MIISEQYTTSTGPFDALGDDASPVYNNSLPLRKRRALGGLAAPHRTLALVLVASAFALVPVTGRAQDLPSADPLSAGAARVGQP